MFWSKFFKIVSCVIAILLLIIFSIFVWPTAYRYDRFSDTTIRTNRFTGETQMLTFRGWVSPANHGPAPLPAPLPERPALGGSGRWVPLEDLPDELKPQPAPAPEPEPKKDNY